MTQKDIYSDARWRFCPLMGIRQGLETFLAVMTLGRHQVGAGQGPTQCPPIHKAAPQ